MSGHPGTCCVGGWVLQGALGCGGCLGQPVELVADVCKQIICREVAALVHAGALHVAPQQC